MPQHDPDELLDVALAAARLGAAIHRKWAGRLDPEDWGQKGQADYVTHVDREAETAVIETIRARFPDHSILAEESGAHETVSASEWLWIVDPLDGTTNFLHGYPMYAASVAVAHQRRIVAGAVVSGATGEAWWARAAGGAFRDGQRLSIDRATHLRHALIGTGFPFKHLDMLPTYLGQFASVLRSSAGIRRAGSASLDLCFVADGRFQGFWELWLAPWDIAAGSVIVREAGGIVTRLDGGDDLIGSGPLLAGTPVVHPALRSLLADAPPCTASVST